MRPERRQPNGAAGARARRAARPHFALQLRNRIAKLIAGLPADHPARVLGEQEIRRLEQLSVDGETRGGGAQDGQRPLASLRG